MGRAHSHFRHFFASDDVASQIVAAGTAAAFCVFASVATIGLSGKVRDMLQPVAGASHASVARYALVLVGAVTTLVVTLALFGVPVGQLLLGGALTSVFVGIAAQQALSNVFAAWSCCSPARSVPGTRSGCGPAPSAALSRAR